MSYTGCRTVFHVQRAVSNVLQFIHIAILETNKNLIDTYFKSRLHVCGFPSNRLLTINYDVTLVRIRPVQCQLFQKDDHRHVSPSVSCFTFCVNIF